MAAGAFDPRSAVTIRPRPFKWLGGKIPVATRVPRDSAVPRVFRSFVVDLPEFFGSRAALRPKLVLAGGVPKNFWAKVKRY